MLGSRLNDIARLIAETGIEHIVVSPGSRNAPLVAALLKSQSFQLHSCPDERSAAFIALGISQQKQYTTAFICTSGSALVNAFPAVLEAYYQRVPLLIISADRPEELIDQWDGQTIQQPGIFGRYVRNQVHINARTTPFHEICNSVFQTVRFSLSPICGPVHLNIALSDPIYEGIDSTQSQENIPPFVFLSPPIPKITEETLRDYLPYKKILVIVGQNPPSHLLSDVLSEVQRKIPVFCDITSLQTQQGIPSWDWGILNRSIPDNLAPELLISLGTVMLSKPLKGFLRKVKPQHIHLSLESEIGDPFQTQPLHIPCVPADFLMGFLENVSDTEYLKHWETFISEKNQQSHQINEPFQAELNWMRHFLSQLEENEVVHLGNSMSVRYGSWCAPTKAAIYSNRGVSGIDGCLSTTMGAAKADPHKTFYCILGDISAIYDAHALWTDVPENIKIIIINNGGGRIFDWIDGPNQLEGLREYIHTPHTYPLENLIQFYGVNCEKSDIAEINVSVSKIKNTKGPFCWVLISGN